MNIRPYYVTFEGTKIWQFSSYSVLLCRGTGKGEGSEEEGRGRLGGRGGYRRVEEREGNLNTSSMRFESLKLKVVGTFLVAAHI